MAVPPLGRRALESLVYFPETSPALEHAHPLLSLVAGEGVGRLLLCLLSLLDYSSVPLDELLVPLVLTHGLRESKASARKERERSVSPRARWSVDSPREVREWSGVLYLWLAVNDLVPEVLDSRHRAEGSDDDDERRRGLVRHPSLSLLPCPLSLSLSCSSPLRRLVGGV